MTESDLHKMILECVNNILNEDGEALGGTSSFSITPDANAAGYDAVAMGGKVQRRNIYQPTTKRSKDFSNGSMMMQHASDETDVNKKKQKK